MSTEPSNVLRRKHSFWLQLVLLSTGIAGLWLSHRSATWYGDSSTRNAVLQTSAIVLVSLAVVARTTQVIVTSAHSDAYRVFRARHLLTCGAVLLGTAILLTGSLILREPLGRLLSRGRVTGGDIADVATGAAAVVCGVGAVVALVGAWDAAREERHWYRSLHSHHRRRI